MDIIANIKYYYKRIDNVFGGVFMKNSRVNKILEGMAKEGLSQMIITSPASIFYLTGKWIYPGERMIALYINKNGEHKLVINKLFPVYEDLGVEIIWYEDTENPIDIYINVLIKMRFRNR